MNCWQAIVGILILIVIGILLNIMLSPSKLQFCPDAWIQNRMPAVKGYNDQREYFIVNGTRRELSEFDLQWIKENCSIQPKIVY